MKKTRNLNMHRPRVTALDEVAVEVDLVQKMYFYERAMRYNDTNVRCVNDR